MTGLEAKISIMDGIILIMLVYGDKAGSNISSYYSEYNHNFVLKVIKTRLSYSKVYSMYYTSSSAVEIPLFMFLSLAEQISKKHTKFGVRQWLS